MNTSPTPFSRRAVIKGIAGITVALPFLEAFGVEAENAVLPRRFCALYTADGMSLPNPKNGISEWNWFPHAPGPDFNFNKSTEPLNPFRSKLSFLGGMYHPSGPKSDPHTCSDMWLTGAPLYNPKPGTYNTVSLDQIVALHTKKFCRQPSLVLSVDEGVGFMSRTGTISFNQEGKPIPAENKPRQVFNRLFQSSPDSLESKRGELHRRIRLVDAVHENAKILSQSLGLADRERLDQYLTSLAEVESRIEASEKWIDIPLKKQDYTGLKLDASAEDPTPDDFYQVMFDLIALAFDADITRSVTFMLTREDGMGISDTFPVKLGLSEGLHKLSHADDRAGQLDFAKFDHFLSGQLAYFLKRLESFSDARGSLLDNSIILYGSGASTTHNTTNLPTLVAGGANMGLKHGNYLRFDPGMRMSNLYLGILHALDIRVPAFSDSTRPLSDGLFG
jgi:hypothetical protein